MMFSVVVDNRVVVGVYVNVLDPIDSVVLEVVFDPINYRYVYV
jgi:hypothetical protein